MAWSSNPNTVRCKNDLSELARLRSFVDAFCGDYALSSGIGHRLTLVLEELLANAALHGPDGARAREVQASLLLEDDRLELVFEDDGAPYEPRPIPPAEPETSLEAWPVGGYGLHLVRGLMDEMSYAHAKGRNLLTLTKRLPVGRTGS